MLRAGLFAGLNATRFFLTSYRYVQEQDVSNDCAGSPAGPEGAGPCSWSVPPDA